MFTLLLAILGLASAPLLAAALMRRPEAETALDALVQVIVVGIVGLVVLPYGLSTAGPTALLALLAGVGLAAALHRADGLGRTRAWLAVAALLLHALLDGAALAAPMDGHHPLATAVVVHTLPVGLAVWRLAHEAVGTARAGLLLGLTGLTMTIGFALTGAVTEAAHTGPTALLLCLLAGGLLDVLIHHRPLPARPATGVGALAGLVVLGFMLSRPGHEHAHSAEPTSLLIGAVLMAVLVAWGRFRRRA